MNLIKKIGACSLLACMGATIMFGTTGCSQPTPEELLKEVNTNLSKVSSFEANTKMDLDMDMSISGTSIPFTTNLDLDIKATTKPSIVYMNGKITMDLFGGTNKGDIESYITVDDKDIVTYTKSTDGSSWSKTVTTDSDAPSSDVLNMLSGITVSDTKYTLEDTKDKINDADVYLLKGTVNYEQVKSLLGSSLLKDSAVTGELVSDNYDYSKFTPSVELYIYKDSKLPAKVNIDMAKALESVVNSVASNDEANTSSSSVTANKFNVNMTFSNFNKVDAITIPDNVLSSAESSTTSDGSSDSSSTTATVNSETSSNS